MKYYMLILLLSFSACFADDDPVINGGVVTGVPVTEVDPPNNSTTPIAPTTTTIPPNSTTTTPTKPTSPSTPPTSPTTPNITTTATPTPKPTSTNPPTPTPAPPPNSTAVPVTTTAPPHHERKFDGPSFVGGIVLALGMVAIGFVAFKFYKARTEMNYHTL